MKQDDPRNCLTFNLQRAARGMARRMDAALASSGLSAQQFSAMAQLQGHGSLSTSGLAEKLGAERTTITRNLARLEDKGLITPDDSGSDRRVNAWRLTQAGQAILQEAFPLWRSAQATFLSEVKDIPPEDLISALRQLE